MPTTNSWYANLRFEIAEVGSNSGSMSTAHTLLPKIYDIIGLHNGHISTYASASLIC